MNFYSYASILNGYHTSNLTGLKHADVGNWDENKAVICGKTFMDSQKLNGESTRNILLNDAV